MKKITPFLWFDDQAEEAAEFYVSIFKKSQQSDSKKSKILSIRHGEDGKVFIVEFELDGQRFTALNGGPNHKFTDAISFVVECETQEEIDFFWNSLSKGGKEVQCGWLHDKYGLSWQIVPSVLPELMSDADPKRSKRVMDAVLKMVKLDITQLRRAYEGE